MVASAPGIQIARTCDAIGKFPDQPAIAFPVRPHCIAVLVIPLRPANREFADLVSAFAQVPRLGDQFDLRKNRILVNDVQERAQPIDLV